MAYQGRNFGLHQTCRKKAQEKFDLNAAVTALKWIESVIGRRLGQTDAGAVRSEVDVAELLKDGTALCEVMNHIKPGAIKKYHKNPSAFQQMENAELFLRACIQYGMATIDTFHVKELYEARAVYTVINCIYALGSLAQQNGYSGPKLGVKIASRNERHFSEEQMQMARRAVSRQHGGPCDASQTHMTPYGLQRQIMLPGTAAAGSEVVDKSSYSIIGLQYGSNQVASQSGMTAYGMQRQISTSTSSDSDLRDSTTAINTDNNFTDNTITTTTTTNTSYNNTPTTPTSPNTKSTTTITRTLPPTPVSPTSPSTPSPRHNPILNSKAKSPWGSSSSSVIGLQYGTNRNASQRGMTAYGMPRQIVSSTSDLTSVGDLGDDGEVGERGDVF